MKPISEVYSEWCLGLQEDNKYDNHYWYPPSDYNPMLNSFGFEIIVKVDDDNYSGDSRLILKDKDRLGYLNFGWGSCSGCDALQACRNIEEIETLRQWLLEKIMWFDSTEYLKAYFVSHDWEGDYCGDEGLQKEFIDKVLEM